MASMNVIRRCGWVCNAMDGLMLRIESMVRIVMWLSRVRMVRMVRIVM